MSIKSFLKSKLFLKHLAIAVAMTLVLFYSILFILRIYTDHGHSYEIPDLKGLSPQEALTVCEQNDFKLQVVDSLFVKDAAPGTIVGQVPVAGTRVKKNRTLFATLCTMAPEQTAMPKLTDIAYRQALNMIESSGLELGNVIYRPSEYTSLVLEQIVNGQPAIPGTLIAKGTRIDLVIGQNFSGEQMEVPNLIGESYLQAKLIIEASILNTGAVIFDDSFISDEDTINAIIWKQRPEAGPGSSIQQGQSIDLWLTVDEQKSANALLNKNDSIE